MIQETLVNATAVGNVMQDTLVNPKLVNDLEDLGKSKLSKIIEVF